MRSIERVRKAYASRFVTAKCTAPAAEWRGVRTDDLGYARTAGLAGNLHKPKPGSKKLSPQRFSITSEPGSWHEADSSDGGGSSAGGGHTRPEEKKVYRIKCSKQIVVTKLPTDATTHREWRSAFLACVSKVDMSKDDI